MDLLVNSNVVPVIIVVLLTYIVYNKFYESCKAANLPPMLPSLPLIGSVLYLPRLDRFHKFSLAKLKTHGEIFSFSMGNNRLAVVLNSRQTIQEALVRNSVEFAGKPHLYTNRMGINPGPHGFVHVAYNDRFKILHQRSLAILKEFGFGKGLMEKRIQMEVDSLIENLKKRGGQAFYPRHIIVCNVLNVITSIVFAKKFEYGDAKLNDIIDTIQDFVAHMQQFVAMDFFHILAMLPYYKRKFNETMETQNHLMEFLDVEIKECLSDTVEENFVKTLINSENLQLETVEIRYIVRDLFLAGSETTATSLQWALILLANHRHVLDRLQREIDDVTSNIGNISLDDRKKVPYMDATILEIMRYKTIVPLGILHETSADTNISGYFIPKGTQVSNNSGSY